MALVRLFKMSWPSPTHWLTSEQDSWQECGPISSDYNLALIKCDGLVEGFRISLYNDDCNIPANKKDDIGVAFWFLQAREVGGREKEGGE